MFASENINQQSTDILSTLRRLYPKRRRHTPKKRKKYQLREVWSLGPIGDNSTASESNKLKINQNIFFFSLIMQKKMKPKHKQDVSSEFD